MTNSELLNLISAVLRGTRTWHAREQDNYQFHPVIVEILDKFTPASINLLALEWPHQPLRDAANVAFTESEQKGEADRQTVTTFGRYIRRHFPDMKDHEIRDYSTKCQNDKYEIWETSDDIVRSVQLGPKSCMTWDNSYTPGHESYDEKSLHPYRVYDPNLGWKAVVRLDPNSGAVNGRALVFHQDNGDKYFVRSYKRGPDYSYADEALEMFLRESGYEHLEEWPEGTPLKKISFGRKYLFPYIDGENQGASVSGDVVVIKHRGEFDCTSTDGTAYGQSELCECCDEYYDEDDMVTVYDRNGYEEQVCYHCRDSYYQEALGRNGNEDYYPEDYVIETIDGTDVCSNFLSDNGVIEIENGEYAFEDDVIESTDGKKFHPDYLPSGYTEIDGVAYHDSEIFQCEEDGETYIIAEVGEPVMIDGNTYHPENVPETEEE